MVLGGAIIAVLLVMYSCNVGRQSPAASTSPSASASAKAAATPTASPTPVTAAAAVQTSATPSQAPVVAGDPSLCTDAELSVIASPAKNPLPSGSEVQINLLIKNVSNRECVRDVGADQQELYIVLGTEKIWSSDNCGALTGSDQRTFPPQHERSYRVIWNGKSSSTCTNKAPGGEVPKPGEYQLFGRVGPDLSDPVTLKLT
jgi:hypothetical protein